MDTKGFITFKKFSKLSKDLKIEDTDSNYLDYLKIHNPKQYSYIANLEVMKQKDRGIRGGNEEINKQEVNWWINNRT